MLSESTCLAFCRRLAILEDLRLSDSHFKPSLVANLFVSELFLPVSESMFAMESLSGENVPLLCSDLTCNRFEVFSLGVFEGSVSSDGDDDFICWLLKR